VRLRSNFLATAICAAALNIAAAAPAHVHLVSGTRISGSNVTEPQPAKSRYLETLHGGLFVIGDAVGFYLYTRVREAPAVPLYITVEYPDPMGGKPVTNDMDFLPVATELEFNSPDAVKGIKLYSDYQIIVRVFDKKGSDVPIDTLVQTVRAYVDTTGSHPRVFKKIRAYPQT
jgi:hypothetical protein